MTQGTAGWKSPARPSIGCGAWARTGNRTFAETFNGPYYAADTGAPYQLTKLVGAVTLDQPGNTFSGQAKVFEYALDGTLTNETPVFSFTGVRITVEQLQV